MLQEPIYVPILKGKEGEYAALESLDDRIKSRLTPVIEVPKIPHDYANERPSKSLVGHVGNVADRIQKCWKDSPFYLDIPWVQTGEHPHEAAAALKIILRGCLDQKLEPIPVVSCSSNPEYISAAKGHMVNNGAIACIRLYVEDFEEDVEIEKNIEALILGLGLTDAFSVDLLIDLGDVSAESRGASIIARSVLSLVPRRDEWRRIILAASSFPEDLSDVGASTIATLPRVEWDLWRTLQRRPPALGGQSLIYGDYAIANPTTKELDPRTMRMSASIRYTTQSGWLIVKGRNVRQFGFSQYFDLCETLVAREEYWGRSFSWGDKFISDCAEHIAGPGNATTWRKVGVNHHITVVVEELSKTRLDL